MKHILLIIKAQFIYGLIMLKSRISKKHWENLLVIKFNDIKYEFTSKLTIWFFWSNLMKSSFFEPGGFWLIWNSVLLIWSADRLFVPRYMSFQFSAARSLWSTILLYNFKFEFVLSVAAALTMSATDNSSFDAKAGILLANDLNPTPFAPLIPSEESPQKHRAATKLFTEIPNFSILVRDEKMIKI